MRKAFDETKALSERGAKHDEEKIMCSARGCPNQWSLKSDRLCYAHRDAERHTWPAVTDEQRRIIEDIAYANANPPPPVAKVSTAEKREILARLRRVFDRVHDPLGWAKALREREKAGDSLTRAQREMWRAAMGEGDANIPADDFERTNALKAQSSKQVEDYAKRHGIDL